MNNIDQPAASLDRKKWPAKGSLGGKVLSPSRIDGFILFFALLLANWRALIFIYLYPDTSALLGPAWIEIALFFLTWLAVLYALVRDHQLKGYLALWRRNWPLALFVFLAFVSAFWSMGFVVTLFRALELLFATLIASYLGMRYRPNQFMGILFWFGAILLIFSIATVFGAPKTGTMYWAPFNGAWRGVYWHRNHLSTVTVLTSLVFICRMLIAFEKRQTTGFLDGVFYILSLVVLISARSATGYILFIVLHFAVFCIWLWIRLSHRLRDWHYYLILAIFLAGAILVLSNLDIVFGLFNRSSTLTGRIPLWDYLLEDVVSQRPWWGHGFGAVWTFDSFRESVRQHIGWIPQPLIADNGFLDILLHLGSVGLLIFVIVLVRATTQSLKYGISHKTLADFFPLLILIYAMIANIPFSLFAETEVFIWFLIVAVLFMTMPAAHAPAAVLCEASCGRRQSRG